MILMGTVLTGCHGQIAMNTFTIPEDFDMSRTYEITFWAKNDTNKTQTAIYQQAIDDFHALYPNITVNMRLYTNYGDIYNDVITNIATATTPNVCITYPDHIATYMTGSEVVVPLDELIMNKKYGLGGSALAFDSPTAAEVVPQFLEECRINGTTYALPFMRSTEACYINKTYVEKLGYTLPDVLTWDFVWEVSEAALAKAADGTYAINGQNVMIPFIYKSTDNMMIQMLQQLDADYSTDSGEILLFNDDTRALLREIAKHGESRAFSTFKISSYPGNFLNAGQCIFAIDSTAGATWMGTDAPLSDISPDKVVKFETAVLPVPQFDTANPKMISQGPSVCLFNKEDPQEVLASWLFTQYLLTDKMQTAYSETEGYIPVTSRAQNSAAYQEYLSLIGTDAAHYDVKLKASELLLSHIGDTFTTPVFNGSASLRDAAGQLIETTVKSVRRGSVIDDAFIDQLYRDTRQLYRLDQMNVAVGKNDLGPLPRTAVILLSALGVVWAGILLYLLRDKLLQKKHKAA